ncbi:ParA family protein [Leuconostoc citreum]|uniref:ParA family protein n=1 Tax=Leuconostoc citreum TaxID=33964 RepID=UPI001120BD66|nr:ParA family protein [Leuconostoc citreum]QEA46407.1 ParA family protein [Leuconostoc citreum]QEA63097.1 ParA family protein [Leuconostoc citreum]TOY70465.1 ParA family protein [Leuconostoc citreum]
MSKTITFSVPKGGAGKTTVTFNFAGLLNSLGYKVLLIDSDYQGSLSSTYNQFTNDQSLFNVFNGGDVLIRGISPLLSILPASPCLEELDGLLNSKNNKHFLMMMWLQDHVDLISDYDYILIDTHPGFNTVTQNMIAVSDYVVVPLMPTDYGFIQAKNQFDLHFESFKADAVDVRTRESLIEAKPIYIGTQVKHNTSISHEFVRMTKDISDFVGYTVHREIYNYATTIGVPIMLADDTHKHDLKAEKEIAEVYGQLLERIKD